jgi:hypothetical protein
VRARACVCVLRGLEFALRWPFEFPPGELNGGPREIASTPLASPSAGEYACPFEIVPSPDAGAAGAGAAAAAWHGWGACRIVTFTTRKGDDLHD